MDDGTKVQVINGGIRILGRYRKFRLEIGSKAKSVDMGVGIMWRFR